VKDTQWREERKKALLEQSRPTFTPEITDLAKGISGGQKA
jgi:hypothetical protein